MNTILCLTILLACVNLHCNSNEKRDLDSLRITIEPRYKWVFVNELIDIQIKLEILSKTGVEVVRPQYVYNIPGTLECTLTNPQGKSIGGGPPAIRITETIDPSNFIVLEDGKTLDAIVSTLYAPRIAGDHVLHVRYRPAPKLPLVYEKDFYVKARALHPADIIKKFDIKPVIPGEPQVELLVVNVDNNAMLVHRNPAWSTVWRISSIDKNSDVLTSVSRPGKNNAMRIAVTFHDGGKPQSMVLDYHTGGSVVGKL